MPDTNSSKPKHIVLTSHPSRFGVKPIPIHWGAADPLERGPVIGTLANAAHRNVIGSHSGAYGLYRALAVATGQLQANHRADLTNTLPATHLGPHAAWADPQKIVSLDPFGALVDEAYKSFYEQEYDICPTIAITTAHINMPELTDAITKGQLQSDGRIVKQSGDLVVTKAAIEPVWYLPGIAKRLGVSEALLRRTLFEQTGGTMSLT
jgi:hypothetical protein